MHVENVTLAKNCEVLDLGNSAFRTYLICNCLLVLKMLGLIALTVRHRMKHKVFISEEDTKMGVGGTVGSHPDVDRVRRAFANDLETIPAFMFVSLYYLFTSTPKWIVHLLYYLFVLARIGHSIVYAIKVVKQPARAVCFLISYFILIYLTLHTLFYAIFAKHGLK
ncbi:prostaglandin E synthase-like [Cylas formicarius]|uniref:prostaglandin E synthase-like n=1 Tax=Cylas formicarius TaxID=197179 RepID=UPI002958CD9C|nr:prostaglandin E synthase-like [Cylas formicarius]